MAIQLYALHNLLYAVGAYPAGALADHFGKRRFLIAAYSLAALMNVLLIALAPSTLTLGLVFAIAGITYAFQQSPERAIAADIVPIEVRSTGFGVFASVNGIGDLISSAIVGVIWTVFSPTVAFSYAFVLTCAGVIMTAIALRTPNVLTGI
jgi:MFS family permease